MLCLPGPVVVGVVVIGVVVDSVQSEIERVGHPPPGADVAMGNENIILQAVWILYRTSFSLYFVSRF